MLLLELDGAEVAEPLLDAAGVIEAVDVLEEREIRVGPGRETRPRMHSVLISIHRFSARALSKESPTEPMDA
ncbi:hypothetical protein O3S80_46270 [Streptomyces sp. Lzd4kr]|nr:hypothetical protein [Streptomyces sp. Lzd4kr]